MKTMAKTLGSEGNKEQMNQSWVQAINIQLVLKIHVRENDKNLFSNISKKNRLELLTTKFVPVCTVFHNSIDLLC